ncbi:MAG: ATP-binding protein, partial [Methylobacter sp.]|nr:ATP-binding protein [Methylobacter sp.]
ILKENIFEKIAREGRKYSVYLLVSSQRPSELSETVLSQCSNFIVHRIQNEIDMRHVYAILPYFSDDFANKIKQSAPGEALVFGNCVSMPLHVKIHQACPEPNSKNCNIPEEWFKPLIDYNADITDL